MRKLPVLLLLITVFLCALQLIPFQQNIAYAHPHYYHSTTQMDTMFAGLVAAYPTLASTQTIGYSMEDHPMYLYKFGNPQGGIIFFEAQLHGDEDLGGEIMYFLMQWVLSSSDPNAISIRTKNYCLFLPRANPDSYHRKNHGWGSYPHTWQYGVNLNRNFQYGFGTSGSGSPGNMEYRGAYYNSENETKAIDYVFSHWNVSFFLDMHMPVVDYVYNPDVYAYLGYWHGLSYTEKNTVLAKYYDLADTEGQETYRLYPEHSANGSIGGGGYAIAEAASHEISSWLIELNDYERPAFATIESYFYPRVKPLFESFCELCELESSSPPDSVNLMNPSEAETIHTNTGTFQYRPIAGGTIQNSSIWMNASGSWARIAWNSTAVLNNTICNYSRSLLSYGTPKNIIWNIQVFNSTTTSVWAAENRTFISDLAPYYEECDTSTTLKGQSATVWRYLADGNGTAHYIFSRRFGSNPWINGTVKSASGTLYLMSDTFTLPDNITTVDCRWYANDTDSQWSASSTFSFTTTSIPTPTTINAVYYFMHGKNYTIRKGCTSHYGNRYVSTAGTDMRIGAWYESNWFNYTVDSAGTQVIDGGFAVPNATYIDGSLKSVGNGWTYSDGAVTVTAATSSAQLYWGSPPPPIIPYSGVGNYTWYMRGDTHTTNDVLGYSLNETKSEIARTTAETFAGSVTVYFGVRVWIVHSDNSTTELSSGQPSIIANRSTDGMGFQNGTWNCDQTDLFLGHDSVKVNLYVRSGLSGSWVTKATFTTDRLMKKRITQTAWGFHIYTRRNFTGGLTNASISFGSTGFLSLISNVGLVDPSVFELMIYNLGEGSFFNFITLPYTYYVGNMFYGLILLVPCATLYMRYRSVMPVLLLCIIFGGAGGFITLMIPAAGLHIGWIFLLFGLAGLLYKVFR